VFTRSKFEGSKLNQESDSYFIDQDNASFELVGTVKVPPVLTSIVVKSEIQLMISENAEYTFIIPGSQEQPGVWVTCCKASIEET
jgi:hypothetical protein